MLYSVECQIAMERKPSFFNTRLKNFIILVTADENKIIPVKVSLPWKSISVCLQVSRPEGFAGVPGFIFH